MNRLECILTELAETLKEIAGLWESDLRWHRRSELLALAASVARGQWIASRLQNVARKLAALDAQTEPNPIKEH